MASVAPRRSEGGYSFKTHLQLTEQVWRSDFKKIWLISADRPSTWTGSSSSTVLLPEGEHPVEVVVLFGGMPNALIRKEQRQSSNLQDPLTGTVDVDGNLARDHGSGTVARQCNN